MPLTPYGRDPASTEPRPTRVNPWPWARWRDLDDREFLRYLKTGEGLYQPSPPPAVIVIDETPPNTPAAEQTDARLATIESQVAQLVALARRPRISPASPSGSGFEGAEE